MTEHQQEQLVLGGDQRPPTPTQRRQMLIAGTQDFMKNNPPEPGDAATAEEAVDNMIAKGIVHLDVRVQAAVTEAEVREFEERLTFTIPRQAEIESRAVVDGGVEIWQEGQHGTEDDDRIHIAAGNVVQLARSLLLAAGFRTVGIYTRVKGGNVDVDDGDLASQIYSDN